jgi:hypothetical protein
VLCRMGREGDEMTVLCAVVQAFVLMKRRRFGVFSFSPAVHLRGMGILK